MVGDLVPDELWEAVGPLLPPERPKPKGGRPRVSGRSALGGIVYVARHGCRWRDVPRDLGASGVSCWRRLREWQALGVWERAHRTLLQWLGDLDAIDLGRASVNSTSVRAKKGQATGPNPTDRGKRGSKYHLIVDRRGVPLAATLTAANVHDSKQLLPLVDAIPPIRRPTDQPGRPRFRPRKLHGDKGYDYPSHRRALRRRGIAPRIARRGVESSERLGRQPQDRGAHDLAVPAYRRLAVHYDRQAATVLGLLHLACSLISVRFLRRAELATLDL